MKTRLIILLSMLLAIMSCSKLEPKAKPEDELLDGPVAGLSFAENAQFLAGDVAFNDEVFTTQTGLGPLFVANSCGSCHAGDGKGTPFTSLTRFGQNDKSGNKFLHLGGPQLQNRAIIGFEPETIPAGASSAKFTPPANTGLGFLEMVSDADILAMADPDDADNDGISGVPNWIKPAEYIHISNSNIAQGDKYIHRFGKKAAAFNLLDQTVNAYNQDMGITSTYKPIDTYSGLSTDPEVSDKTILNIVFYLQTLKAPIQRDQNDATVIAGKAIFKSINCASCHRAELKTAYSRVAALSYQKFYPYTDLLLHDMGKGLDDGYTEGSAETFEWRTPALWGLGLSPASQGGQYFLLHDGRAKSIEEAILLHGGEALKSRKLYQQLAETDKNALIRFLKSL